MKRQKLVFSTDEIPHLWMHKTQSEARNPLKNLYFENETIYSYGSHFPIARHVTNKKGESAILFTTATYSVTTSRHISLVSDAMHNTTVPVFRVEKLARYAGDIDHSANLKAFVRDSEKALRSAVRSRKYATMLLNEAFGYEKQAQEYAKFFRIKAPKFPFLPANKELEGLKEQFQAQDRKQAAKDAKERRERERQYKIEEEKAAIERQARLVAWMNGEQIDTYLLRGCDCQLRIVGNEVETSQGAVVPVRHARLALRMVRHVMESGQEFVTNGHSIHIGHYMVNRIAPDGTLTAGCHVIKWNAIQRIAEQLDNFTAEDSDNIDSSIYKISDRP